MKQNLLKTFKLRVLMLVALLCAGFTSAWGETVTETITFSSQGYSNGQVVSSTEGTNTLVTFTNGSTNTAYYTTGTAIRIYGGGSATFTASDNLITKVKLTFASSNAPSSSDNRTIWNPNQGVTISNDRTIWEGSAKSVSITRPSGSGHWRLQKAEITYEVSGSTVETCAEPTFSPAAGTYTSAQNVTISSTTSGATIYYTTNGNEPTINSSVYSGAISVGETTTIKAMAVKSGMENSSVAEATYTILGHAGTETDPYTVADARAAIDANSGVNAVYATGVVSNIVTAYNSQYSNITFDFVDSEGDTNTLRAYRCGGDKAANVQVGDVVVVSGNLTLYGTTYEFSEGCTLVSLTHPANPIIIANPNSLSSFTYEVGNGPSVAQTIIASGENLTDNISLSLGSNSNFEMSLSEESGYTDNLTLTQTDGTVASTTIYVRLKAGLAVESYTGSITLTSTDATDATINLSGSVTAPEAANVTWNLSIDETATATTTEMTWTSDFATMGVEKAGAGTSTNNYYPGTSGQNYTSTRFYKNSELTITPVVGYTITSVVFTATTEGYATALGGSTWTNATASASGTTVTVTPENGATAISAVIGGTCGFTSVKVYYESDTTPMVNYTGTLNPFTYVETEGPSEAQSITVTGINLTSVVSVAASSDYELSLDNTTYSSSISITPSSGVINQEVAVRLKSGLAKGNHNGTLTMTSTGVEDVTINLTGTVAEKVVPVEGSYELVTDASTLKENDEIIIAHVDGEGLVSVALGTTQNENNRSASDVNYNENDGTLAPVSSTQVITLEGSTGAWYFNVGSGYLYAASSDKNWLRTEEKKDNNAKATIVIDEDGDATITFQGTNTHNVLKYNASNDIFSCYASGQQSVQIYRKVNSTPETVEVSVGSTGFATFSCDKALDFTAVEEIYAYTATVSGQQISFTRVYQVPANTGLLLRNPNEEAATTADVPVITEADPIENNALVAVSEEIASLASENSDGSKNYILNKPSGKNVGFFLANNKKVGAGKAYLTVPVGVSGVKSFAEIFGGDTDAIENLDVNVNDNATIYNIAGQRVGKMTKGLYIVNGKKVLVK